MTIFKFSTCEIGVESGSTLHYTAQSTNGAMGVFLYDTSFTLVSFVVDSGRNIISDRVTGGPEYDLNFNQN